MHVCSTIFYERTWSRSNFCSCPRAPVGFVGSYSVKFFLMDSCHWIVFSHKNRITTYTLFQVGFLLQNSHLPRHRKLTNIHRINSLAQCLEQLIDQCLKDLVCMSVQGGDATPPPKPIPAWRAIRGYFLSSFISCSVLLFCIRLSTNSVIQEPYCVFSFTVNLLHITTYGTDFNIFKGLFTYWIFISV